MVLSPKTFWDWFTQNSNQFFFLNQIEDPAERERLLNIFLNKLHEYCDQLFFEIGGHPDEVQDLIITAEGNKEYFGKVEELVNAAPDFKNWNIIAFKPPVGTHFETSYKGITLTPSKLWFLPLESKNHPSKIGLRICIDNYDPRLEKDFLAASFFVLDSILGEKSSTLDIQYVEVGKLPDNPQNEGLIELTDLQGYIKWKKSKMSKV